MYLYGFIFMGKDLKFVEENLNPTSITQIKHYLEDIREITVNIIAGDSIDDILIY